MKLNHLTEGKLLKRYKRFLADVELNNGDIITAHCTNTGSMKSCIEIGAPVLLSHAAHPHRKTAYTWEMIKINDRWVGVNTQMANKIAFDLLKKNAIPNLENLRELKSEVKFEDSRFDIFGLDGDREVWMEVKNVSMKVDEFVLFPDAITTRGQKHLKTLMRAIDLGHRAVMIYLIQRTDVSRFGAAKDIDPDYASLLQKAQKKGVEIYPVQVELSPTSIELFRILKY